MFNWGKKLECACQAHDSQVSLKYSHGNMGNIVKWITLLIDILQSSEFKLTVVIAS